MKNRSNRISKIFDIAKIEEKKTCETMGRAQRSLDEEIERLRELESYRSSYTAQFNTQRLTNSARWQDYQNFLERIEKAVATQKAQILIGEESRDAHRRRWMLERRKVESLERVVSRYRKAEENDRNRQSQKRLDDLVATGRFSKTQVDD